VGGSCGAAGGGLIAGEIGRRRQAEQSAAEEQRLEHQLADVPFGQDLEGALEQDADRPPAQPFAADVEVTDEAADVEREKVADPIAAAADDAIGAGGGAAEAARFPVRDRGLEPAAARARRPVVEREADEALVPLHGEALG
jgi:hypothetical protein